MDVQLAAATPRTDADGSAPPAPPQQLDATASAPSATSSSPLPAGAPSSNGASQQPAPAAPPKHDEGRLSDAVSHLFGGGTKVDVTYVVTEHPNEIVTVFKNAATGEVLAQFPPEVMLKLAHFFQQLAGGVLDRTV